MKKITIGLNKKDIENAQKYLLNLKKQIPKMQQEFLMAVAKWIVKQADGYIDRSDIGSLVKAKIKESWDYQPTNNGIKIINNANIEKTVYHEKQTVPIAVLVEFGSGVVGQSEAHPNATQEGYEYNVDSKGKNPDGSWSFWLNSNERDLPMSAFTDFGTYDDHRAGGKRMVVTTFGAKGVWYAYNAIVDAQMELAKANGGEIGALWETVKRKYIK
jgi:hypothetical protein